MQLEADSTLGRSSFFRSELLTLSGHYVLLCKCHRLRGISKIQNKALEEKTFPRAKANKVTKILNSLGANQLR